MLFSPQQAAAFPMAKVALVPLKMLSLDQNP